MEYVLNTQMKFVEVMEIQKLLVLYSLVCRRHIGVPLWNTKMAATPHEHELKFICPSI